MSITRINTNAEAVLARVAIQKLERAMNTSMSHLSTGMRLTSASDDPSSLSIYNNTRAELAGVRTAITNTQEGLALLRTADSSMTSMLDKMIQMRDIAVRAANDATLSTDDLAALSDEYKLLYADLFDYATVDFNGVNLFDTAGGTGGKGLGVTATGVRIQFGPKGGATTVADSIKLTISKGMAGTSIASKPLANSTISNVTMALANIGELDDVLTAWTGQQAKLGSDMRFVETKLNDLQSTEINLASVVSTVGDADMASELADFTRNQILSQAATAMMAQANIQSGSMLSLLMG
jgi:flagellin